MGEIVRAFCDSVIFGRTTPRAAVTRGFRVLLLGGWVQLLALKVPPLQPFYAVVGPIILLVPDVDPLRKILGWTRLRLAWGWSTVFVLANLSSVATGVWRLAAMGVVVAIGFALTVQSWWSLVAKRAQNVPRMLAATISIASASVTVVSSAAAGSEIPPLTEPLPAFTPQQHAKSTASTTTRPATQPASTAPVPAVPTSTSGRTTSTTVAAIATCDRRAAEAELARPLARLGFTLSVIDRIERKVFALAVGASAVCVPTNFVVTQNAQYVLFEVLRGNERLTVIADQASNLLVVREALARDVVAALVTHPPVQMREVLAENTGVDLIVLDDADGRCRLVYRYRKKVGSPVITVGADLAPIITSMAEDFGQAPRLRRLTGAAGFTLDFGGPTVSARHYRLTNSGGRPNLEGPDASRFGSPPVCSRTLDSLKDAP